MRSSPHRYDGSGARQHLQHELWAVLFDSRWPLNYGPAASRPLGWRESRRLDFRHRARI